MSYFFFYLNKLRHFFLLFLSVLLLYSCLTTSSGDSVRAITEKGRIDTVYDKKFKGTPEFLAKTYDDGRNWQIFLKQTGVFMAPKKSKLREIKDAGNFVARRLCEGVNLPFNKINLIEGSFITKAEIEGSFSCGFSRGNDGDERDDRLKFPSAKIFSSCMTSKKNDNIAVLVANGNYTNQTSNNIPAIKPAYANLESMEAYVNDCLGIKEENTYIIKDATLANMQTYFGSERDYKGKIYNSVNNNEEVFIYYVGHGAPSYGDGLNYLITSDADEYNISNSSFPTRLFYENISKIESDNVTVVVDTCFSGKQNDGQNYLNNNASPLFELEEEVPQTSRNLNIITAGASNEIASWTMDGNHTLLTKYFLLATEEMPLYSKKSKNNFNPKLIDYIQEEVRKDALKLYGRNQLPQFIDD